MKTQLLMGNEAIALGAIRAGVNLVSGYPGTPSTEILETVAKYNTDARLYVEWSVNEKAALEVAAGAAYSGARVLVTMKQVGLNVASDPLMSLAYVGVKGGMVIVSADDPGPISSQTEQDTRHFARFAKLPVFDPSSPEEAYDMIQAAFALSEEYGTPVLFRPTTRVCHGCASMTVPVPGDVELPPPHVYDGFIKDTMRWVIFPRTSYMNHVKIEKRNNEILPQILSANPFNKIEGKKITSGVRRGIVTSGISYAYTKEALRLLESECNTDFSNAFLFKVGIPYPFPEQRAVDFLHDVDEVVVIEELDPVLERELVYLCGKYHLDVTIQGKLTSLVQPAGENTVESVKNILAQFYGVSLACASNHTLQNIPELPVRPPVLCAGCPHRASFYAVKQAAKKRKAVFCGDIGCYTLGNAKPLDMTDTCLCMGADITIAQGIYHIAPDTVCFSFIGDSTFFAAGITGIVNAVYNQAKIVVIVLDNSTTAMTGQQPHPGTGITMMGKTVPRVSIRKVLEGIGVAHIMEVDPLDTVAAITAVTNAVDYTEKNGVSAVLFKSPCISVAAKLGYKPRAKCVVDATKCIGCKKCINELGCPALVTTSITETGKARVTIEPSLCTGCMLCSNVCAAGAIGGKND